MTQSYPILIVDDESDISKLLARKLGDVYQVEIANNAAEAIARFGDHPFPVVITDIRMPGIDGIALMQTLKSLHPETEVILMSGYADHETILDALNTQAFAFVSKPLSLPQVQRRIEQAFAVVEAHLATG